MRAQFLLTQDNLGQGDVTGQQVGTLTCFFMSVYVFFFFTLSLAMFVLLYYWLSHFGEIRLMDVSFGFHLPAYLCPGPMKEGPNRVEIRQKAERRRDGQGCFHSLPHAISITPPSVFVITSCHCSMCCWLYAHKCVPVTHIHKDWDPREEVMSCLQRVWKWLVMLMV